MINLLNKIYKAPFTWSLPMPVFPKYKDKTDPDYWIFEYLATKDLTT